MRKSDHNTHDKGKDGRDAGQETHALVLPSNTKAAAGNLRSTNWAESSTNRSRGRDCPEIPPSPRRLRMTGFSRRSSRSRSMPWRFSRAICRQRSWPGLTGRRWRCCLDRLSNPASSRCVVENPFNDAPVDLSYLFKGKSSIDENRK